MKITEENIDLAIAELNDNESEVDRLLEKYEYVMAYLASESSELLTEVEYLYLSDLALILLKVIDTYDADFIPAEEKLWDAEEDNWARWESQGMLSFRKKLDHFFEGYPEEDLLAFIEDSLEPDEDEDVLTGPGREVIFIGLKSIVDSFFV